MFCGLSMVLHDLHTNRTPLELLRHHETVTHENKLAVNSSRRSPEHFLPSVNNQSIENTGVAFVKGAN